MDFIAELQKISERVKINEPMSAHTSIGIGGPADYYIEVENESQLKRLIALCPKFRIPYFLVGEGSNLLVKDGGIRGVVIKLIGDFEHVKIKDEHVVIGAGVGLPRLLKEVTKEGLEGLEFLIGIPGTFGGAIFMNAGAYGKSISERVNWVKVMDSSTRVKVLASDDLRFTYRGSNLSGYIILEAEVVLDKSEKGIIEEKMKELIEIRKSTQPLHERTFGCVFKNPKGYIAGELISKAGLAGLKIGDVKVSTKHANFIQNAGQAKAKDALAIIERIKKEVMERFGVLLEEEVITIGKNSCPTKVYKKERQTI
ncbi:MAG: UDP-N-acetylmuramate dehydrogenase [bacterium]|nr:UDP-N-acetylmuramate dehydrogenase [bacterium]